MNKRKIVLASTLAVLMAPTVLGNISNQLAITAKADDTTTIESTIKKPVGIVNYGGTDTVDSKGNKTGLFLPGQSSWKLGESILINNQRFYEVGSDQYVSSLDITVTYGTTPVAPVNGGIGIVNYGGADTVDINGNKAGLFLPGQSSWKLGTSILINNERFYAVGQNQYVSSLNITITSGVTPVVPVAPNDNNIGTLGYEAKVVDSNGNPNGVVLPAGSSWKLGKFTTINGNGYYQVATDEYVLATIVNSSKYSFTANLKNNATIYNSSTKSLTRTLPVGSSWKITTVVRNRNNDFWGKVSTNEWIKIDSNLGMSYGDSDSIPSVAISEPDFATSVSNDNSSNTNNSVNLTATLTSNQSVYDTSTNTMSRILPSGTSWKINQVVRNKNNQFWGKVSTNEWILIDANNLSMSYGDSDTVPNVAISEPEFATSVIK